MASREPTRGRPAIGVHGERCARPRACGRQRRWTRRRRELEAAPLSPANGELEVAGR